MGKHKHITGADRLEIEHGLRHRLSIKKIVAKIGKQHSTLAREIRAHSLASDKGAFGRVANRRIRRLSCDRRQLCEDRPDCLKRCSACRLCNSVRPAQALLPAHPRAPELSRPSRPHARGNEHHRE